MATPKANTGVLAGFTHFLGSVATEGSHIVGGVLTAGGHALGGMATSIYHYPQGIYRGINDRLQIDQNQAMSQHLNDSLDSLRNLYKSGRISKADYQSDLSDLTLQNNKLVESAQSLDNRVNIDKSNAYQATVDLASAIVTVITGGTDLAAAGAAGLAGDTGVSTAADYLASTSAHGFLAATENGLTKVAADEVALKGLTPAAQMAARDATISAAKSAGNSALASQVSRAAAVNLAFKYPLTYVALSSTGHQLYNQLDQKQYGAAVRTAAFNALLVVAGGPILSALKYGGTAIKDAAFGKTTFWDELSKYYGDGSANGFTRAVQQITSKMAPEDAKIFVKNLANVEATNVHAMGGDVASAAARLANGMKNVYGFDLSTVDHQSALHDMAKFAKNQQLADQTAKDLNLGSVTAGRFDARDKNVISASLSPAMEAGGKQQALQAWEDLKASNPSQSWANNQNVDKQIKNLINQHPDSGSLDNAIRNIRAAFTPEGFPSDVAKQMAKDGYIPIKPVNLEAPFVEGGAKFKSSFAPDNNLFLKTVQPLPILSHLGDALTSIGLSPNASTQAVYQVFNSNLAKNLQEAGVVEHFAGFGAESAQQSTDTLIKQLSDYAHSPTRGGLNINGNSLRPPITDLRQLTVKDIQAAVEGTSGYDANKIKDAISQAMLDVPINVRGMGDRLVDRARQVPGFNRYLGLQGAARFGWNPFFKVKLMAKTESLTQLQSGGKILTIPGTNSMIRAIAPETYANIENTRTVLRDAGIFDTAGKSGFAGGEGFADVGANSANLSHHLLPSQERSISSLINTQAAKTGLTPEQFVNTFNQQTRDTVQAITGYDRNANFLNSPMARTINLAFFPFRFNIKVAGFMARALQNADTVTQFAVVHGLYNAGNWLNSAEGQAWYSRNSDVIGLIKYFTPLETLSTMAHILGQQPNSVGNFGEMGGLPFGWIPQLLDAEGITHGLTQSPYVSPKTGDVIPTYVPATDKGRLLTAIQDLIGSVYTYPGSTVGMPSKTGLDRNIAIGLTGANKKTDLSLSTPAIPAGLQSFSDAVKAANPAPAPLANNAEAQNQFLPKGKQPTPNIQPNQMTPGTTVPRLPSSGDNVPNKVPKAAKASSTKGLNANGTKKLKKAQFTPALLPGQSSLGQL
jgi:hypothetical protein